MMSGSGGLMRLQKNTVAVRAWSLAAAVCLLAGSLTGCRSGSDTEAAAAYTESQSAVPGTGTQAAVSETETESSFSEVQSDAVTDLSGEDVSELAEDLTEETEPEEAITVPDTAPDTESETAPDDQAEGFLPVERPPYLPGYCNLVPGSYLIGQFSLPRPQRNLHVLKYRLRQILSGYDGVWSVCVKDLSTGEQIVINDIPMPSASIMKLFILGCIDDEVRFGRLDRTSELVARLSGMIRASSNQDANALLLALGGGDYSAGINWLNQYIRNSGYSDATVAYNPFQDEALRLDENHVNQTSAADCALLLERIYRRTFGTRSACEEAEALMLAQDTRYKIPAGLPDGVQVGNKTGETGDTENDAAVIYTPTGDYILTIFSTGWADKNVAQSHFKELSAAAYSYFTDPSCIDRWFPVFLPQ